MTQTGRKLQIDIFPAHQGTRRAVQKNERWGYVRKDETGKERRYLCGISSGLAVDGHGERMSAECVESFIHQSVTKDILLFVNHDRNWSEDIGILTKSELTPEGDWYTEYRLYDLNDAVGERSIEEAEKAWARANGQPPYKHPVQFGFSIEGFIPDDAILNPRKPDGSLNANGMAPVMLAVDLDPGVALVSRPAYHKSIATAIAKALSTNGTPRRSIFQATLEKHRTAKSSVEDRFTIDRALDDSIDQVTSGTEPDEAKAAKLGQILDEYKRSILAHAGLEGAPMKPTAKGLDQLPPDLQTQLIDVIADLKLITDAIHGTGEQTQEEPAMATKRKEEEVNPEESRRAPTADSAAGYVDPAKEEEEEAVRREEEEEEAKKAFASLTPSMRKALSRMLKDEEAMYEDSDDTLPEGGRIVRDVPSHPEDEGAGALNAGKKPKDAEDLTGADNESQMGVVGPDADEVAKSIAVLAQVVGLRKSAPRKTVQVTKAEKVARDSVRVMAAMADRLNAVEKALTGIMEGFGLGEEITRIKKAETTERQSQPAWWGQSNGGQRTAKGYGAHLGGGAELADMIADSLIRKSQGQNQDSEHPAGKRVGKELAQGNVMRGIFGGGQRV